MRSDDDCLTHNNNEEEEEETAPKTCFESFNSFQPRPAFDRPFESRRNVEEGASVDSVESQYW